MLDLKAILADPDGTIARLRTRSPSISIDELVALGERRAVAQGEPLAAGVVATALFLFLGEPTARRVGGLPEMAFSRKRDDQLSEQARALGVGLYGLAEGIDCGTGIASRQGQTPDPREQARLTSLVRGAYAFEDIECLLPFLPLLVRSGQCQSGLEIGWALAEGTNQGFARATEIAGPELAGSLVAQPVGRALAALMAAATDSPERAERAAGEEGEEDHAASKAESEQNMHCHREDQLLTFREMERHHVPVPVEEPADEPTDGRDEQADSAGAQHSGLGPDRRVLGRL